MTTPLTPKARDLEMLGIQQLLQRLQRDEFESLPAEIRRMPLRVWDPHFAAHPFLESATSPNQPNSQRTSRDAKEATR